VPHRIEPLGRQHQRGGFDCGEPSLNGWLAQFALQHQRKSYSRTHVLIDDARPRTVLGYYALTPHEVDSAYFPRAGSLPRRLPCILLGRLAVDRAQQGRSYGEVLLYDAIECTRHAMADIGGIGLLADALNDKAVSFYQQYGFESFRDDPRRVVLYAY
jgi:GNAT superfamily N-acetyltransferase